ncbi:MAG TPA: sterol desaturase family protein [Bryobacteraceae bacterium]|nr:sterol desaturase family protein [Bryobacteraceae bacterium]
MDSAWLSQGGRLESYILFGTLICFALVETFVPLRPLVLSMARRWLNHGVLLAINTGLNVLLFRGGAVVFAILIRERGYGLFHRLEVPYLLAFAISFAAIDLAHYGSHIAYHRIGLLWRIHRVHHADPDFDVTTGFRFHPAESVLTQALVFALIALTGPPPLAVLAAEIATIFEDIFEHANVEIPSPLDRFLRLWLITPNMHRVHHSVEIGEQNCNFGTIFPWWDRLFGTYAARPSAGLKEMETGLAGYPAQDSASIASTLAMPFIASSEQP